MIRVEDRGGMGGLLSKVLFRDQDFGSTYHVPGELYHRIAESRDASVLLVGPKNNLSVTLELPTGPISLSDMAPPGTEFIVDNVILYGPVRTDGVSQIQISAGRNYADVVTFGILHAMGRLAYHDDAQKHAASVFAHDALNKELSYLQAYAKVPVERDSTVRARVRRSWELVTGEEKAVNALALGYARDLLLQGSNPFPHIHSYRQLTDLVNTDKVLRTLSQHVINTQATGRRLGLPMTLSEDQVANIMSGLDPLSPRPFR